MEGTFLHIIYNICYIRHRAAGTRWRVVFQGKVASPAGMLLERSLKVIFLRGAGLTALRKSEFRLGENVTGGQNVNKRLPGSGGPQSIRPPGRDPENHKIRCFSQRGSEASPERPRGAEVGSKAAPGVKKEAKSSLLGASGEAFWGKIRDSGPLRKH